MKVSEIDNIKRKIAGATRGLIRTFRVCVTDAMRGNNEEVVEDCMEACRDCTGTARLCRRIGACDDVC